MKTNVKQSVGAVFQVPVQVQLALCALAALLWVWWPTLAAMATRWGTESQYSHGFLVPLFGLILLWSRRQRMPKLPLRPSAWGLAWVAAGLALHFLGTYIYFDWLCAIALLPCLAGLSLLAGGRRALEWTWPAIAFLVFMVPLPHTVEVGLAHPLQRAASLSSTYVLQTLGFAAFAEGNIIRMGETRLNVVEACSGLSMLIVFFALATAVVLLSHGSLLEKTVIFLSAVPIALIANITRIVVTGILHRTVGSEWADYVFHDLAGWLMPLLALGLLWAEVRLLNWILVARPARKQESVRIPGVGTMRGTPSRKPQTQKAPKRPKGAGAAPVKGNGKPPKGPINAPEGLK